MKYCIKCGNTLTDEAVFCDKCGSEVNDTQSSEKANEKKKINTYSLVGFILGVISFFINFMGLVGTLAIVFSCIGLNQISAEDKTSKTLSLIGIVSGAINVLYAIYVLINYF